MKTNLILLLIFLCGSVMIYQTGKNKGYKDAVSEYTQRYIQQKEQIAALESKMVIEVSELESQHKEELKNVKNDADSIISSIRNGTVRLRGDLFKCKSRNAPDSATTTGFDEGSRTQLQKDVAGRIIRVGSKCDEVAVKFSLLQDYVNNVCLAGGN